MRCTVLASGSKGNSVVIAGSSGAILIDAGLSTKELLRRMDAAGIDPGTVDAVLVTHEHGDHVRGLDVLLRRLNRPVYATEGTLADFLNHRGHLTNRSSTTPAGAARVSPSAISVSSRSPRPMMQQNRVVISSAKTAAGSGTVPTPGS